MGACANATCASCKTDHLPIWGSVIMYSGGLVARLSGTPSCISLGFCEAEFIFVANCTKEILFVQQVLAFMLPSLKGRERVVPEDNEGSINLAKNPLELAQWNHVDIRYHFIWNEIREGRIAITRVRSENQ